MSMIFEKKQKWSEKTENPRGNRAMWGIKADKKKKSASFGGVFSLKNGV
jgi:hypothetical protein